MSAFAQVANDPVPVDGSGTPGAWVHAPLAGVRAVAPGVSSAVLARWVVARRGVADPDEVLDAVTRGGGPLARREIRHAGAAVGAHGMASRTVSTMAAAEVLRRDPVLWYLAAGGGDQVVLEALLPRARAAAAGEHAAARRLAAHANAAAGLVDDPTTAARVARLGSDTIPDSQTIRRWSALLHGGPDRRHAKLAAAQLAAGAVPDPSELVVVSAEDAEDAGVRIDDLSPRQQVAVVTWCPDLLAGDELARAERVAWETPPAGARSGLAVRTYERLLADGHRPAGPVADGWTATADWQLLLHGPADVCGDVIGWDAASPWPVARLCDAVAEGLGHDPQSWDAFATLWAGGRFAGSLAEAVASARNLTG